MIEVNAHCNGINVELMYGHKWCAFGGSSVDFEVNGEPGQQKKNEGGNEGVKHTDESERKSRKANNFSLHGYTGNKFICVQ